MPEVFPRGIAVADLQPRQGELKNPSALGENEEVFPGVRGDDLAEEVAFLGADPDHALSAPALGPKGIPLRHVHVAFVRHAKDHFQGRRLPGNAGEIIAFKDRGAAGITVAISDGLQFLADHLIELPWGGEDGLVILDLLPQVQELLVDLLALQFRELGEAHAQDGLGLLLAQADLRGQQGLGLGGFGRTADDLDHLV